MSSLAFNAAPFDNQNTSENISDTNDIERKRQMKNKTIKRKLSTKGNVENMIKQINQYKSMDDDDENMNDFTPPPKPLSRTQIKNDENEQTIDSTDDVDVENFQNLPSLVADEYYQQYVPYFDRINETGGGVSKDDLVKKLDYMIHLLEEQQETKTNTVTEEVILYSFLGVFIIFVLDSFARASKYVR
jgi:hypothetical protein